MKTFRDSSMVEQLPVKELVPGSSPGRGAKKKAPEHVSGVFLFLPRPGLEDLASTFVTERKQKGDKVY